MMRRFGQDHYSRLGREQIEVSIDLERIGVNDLGPELVRHVRRDIGFSDGGRTNDVENTLHQ
jgi:hypothetical protein